MISATCIGACCSVFPIRGWAGRDHSRVTDGAYIEDMLLPLTLDEATARWEVHGYGHLPEQLATSPELYSCRHWDTDTHLCRAYEARPDLCRDFPYGIACLACGFQVGPEVIAKYGYGDVPKAFDWSQWRWDARRRGYRTATDQTGRASDEHWRWDPDARILYPTDNEAWRWSARRRKWEATDVPD